MSLRSPEKGKLNFELIKLMSKKEKEGELLNSMLMW